MPVTINGNGSITGLAQGGIDGTKVVTSAAQPAGSVIQTVSSTFAPYGEADDALRAHDGTYSETGITLSITPTVSTSKIMVMSEGCSFGYKTSDSQVDYFMRLVGTPSGGSLTQFREIVIRHSGAGTATQRHFDSWNMAYLDDHNDTDPVEYKVQHALAAACTYVWARYKGATVTLMEIAT